MAVLGCVIGDFTGASDAASFLVEGGMNVRLYNGVPDRPALGEGPDRHYFPDRPDDAQAIVIALKSRTQETSRTVAGSPKATRLLLTQGVKQIYLKHCSTFDSTPKSNIGPVADTLMDLTKAPYTLLCPALPVNGRTVEHGMFLIDDVPLYESHMRGHPLAPMWDCRTNKLMEPQSRYECRCLTTEEVEHFFPGSLEQVLGSPLYLIPDYKEPKDGSQIVAAFGHLPPLTGGGGFLEPLAQMWTGRLPSEDHIPESGTDGEVLLLVGGCSRATLGQIAWCQSQGKPCYKLDPAAVPDGRQALEDAWQFIETHSSNPDMVLVYSSDTPEKVKEFQELGIGKIANMPEGTTARPAVHTVEQDCTKIVSAGGGTSGAVAKGLESSSYWMGGNTAPEVPIMVPTERSDIHLILKSGNFEQGDLFGRTLTVTSK